MVAKWESAGSAVHPRPVDQAALDTSLRLAHPSQIELFEAIRRASGSKIDREHVTMSMPTPRVIPPRVASPSWTMTNSSSSKPEDLRDRMVDRIRRAGFMPSERVEQAMRTVPRHLFVPAVSAADAYADRPVIVKSGPTHPLSSVSMPTVVAIMLGQLDPQPGDNVLEIGAGAGYNAALLAELVGPTGAVTTVDIDPDVTAHARSALTATGYDHVRVITADGALGAPEHAPFDKIIVTVGPWDLPPAWFDQLAVGGRLVVPLQWRGQTRSIAFTRHADHLRAADSQPCAFIPMIGLVPNGERSADIADGVTVFWDDDQQIDPGALRPAATSPGTTLWSGVAVTSYQTVDGIWLWLTVTEPNTCRLAATDEAIARGPIDPIFPAVTPAIADGDSFGYLTKTRRPSHNGQRRYELGATGHGPRGPQLAERLVTVIRRWNLDRAAQPVVTAWPAGTRPSATGRVIPKRHTTLVLEGG